MVPRPTWTTGLVPERERGDKPQARIAGSQLTHRQLHWSTRWPTSDTHLPRMNYILPLTIKYSFLLAYFPLCCPLCLKTVKGSLMLNGPEFPSPYDSAFRGLHPLFVSCEYSLRYNPPFQISSYPSAPQTTPVHSCVQDSVLWPMDGLRTVLQNLGRGTHLGHRSIN